MTLNKVSSCLVYIEVLLHLRSGLCESVSYCDPGFVALQPMVSAEYVGQCLKYSTTKGNIHVSSPQASG